MEEYERFMQGEPIPEGLLEKRVAALESGVDNDKEMSSPNSDDDKEMLD